jgi:hypothetical protein
MINYFIPTKDNRDNWTLENHLKIKAQLISALGKSLHSQKNFPSDLITMKATLEKAPT